MEQLFCANKFKCTDNFLEKLNANSDVFDPQGAVDDDGKIQGLDVKVYYNFGSQITSVYSTIIPYLRLIVPNCYEFSTWSFTCYSVKLDLPPASILRSPCE